MNKIIKLTDAQGNLREVEIEDFDMVKNLTVYVVSGNEAISINRGMGSVSQSTQFYVDPTCEEREVHSLEGYYDVYDINRWGKYKGNAHEKMIEFGKCIPKVRSSEYLLTKK